MANETSLWNWLKKARDYFGSALHIRRVENAVSTGDPDADGILKGKDFTIELKCCARPARGSTRLRYHDVTINQVEWHKHRLAAGGASAFLIQVGDGPEAVRYLVHGAEAHALAEGVNENWLIAHAIKVGGPADAVERAVNLRSAFSY